MKTNWMGKFTHVAVLAVMVLVLAAVPAWGASKAEKQKEVQKVSRETLARLYKAQPSAKKAVEGAAGYAVFSNFGMKILVAGGGSGSGIAVDNKTKKATYMKMVEVQAGLGMGIKKFRVVFVFDTQKGLNDFVNSGWEFGGQTTAAAKSGDQGARAERGCLRCARRLDVSAHRHGPRRGDHGERDEVLQGQRSELGRDGTIPCET